MMEINILNKKAGDFKGNVTPATPLRVLEIAFPSDMNAFLFYNFF